MDLALQQPTDLTYQPCPKKVIPLTGKWIPAYEGVDLGLNYKQLTNLRYTDTHLQGIGGMTKINTSVMHGTHQKVRSAFHYTKSQPAESHLLAQAYNSDLSASVILQNKTAIPSPGVFETEILWSDAVGAGRGYFSIAPDETLIYCNGKENLIWGGDEAKIGGFFIANPDSQVIYDYTDKVRNLMDDVQNVATMTTTGGGIDAYAMVVLHGENNADDSSGKTHNFTVSGVTYATANPKFGTYCFSFTGSANSVLYCADHADFNVSGGIWSTDAWVYFNSFNAVSTIWAQATDANNYHRLYVNTSGIVIYNLVAAGVEKSTIASGIGSIQLGRWHHVEMTENGNDYYLFIDGVKVASMSTADRPANYTQLFSIGGFTPDSSSWSGFAPMLMDEFRLSVGAARHTQGFTPQASAYSASSSSTLYIVSPRPLEAIKLYLKTVNTAVASVASDYWTGSAYSKTSSPIDYMEYGSDAAARAAYVSSDTGTDITLDLMEYSSDTAVQAAYATSDTDPYALIDYMEYSSDANAQAAYVTDSSNEYGAPISDKGSTTGAGYTCINSATAYLIGKAGTIRKVKYYTGSAGVSIKFKVFRVNGSNYDFVGESEAFSTSSGGATRALTTPITGVQANDIIGIYTSSALNNNVSPDAGAGCKYISGDITTNTAISGWSSSATGVYAISCVIVDFDSFSESTVKTQGSYSLKGVAVATGSLNKTLTRSLSTPIDLSGINSVKFDIRSTRTGSNVKLGLRQRYLPNDSYTKLLLHFEQNVTDSSSSGHALSKGTGVTYASTAGHGFGYHASFDGSTNATLYAPDSADFDFSGGVWTVDCIIYFDLSATRSVFSHPTDANNYLYAWVGTNGSVNIDLNAAGSITRFSTPASTILASTKHHIAFVENGNDWYIFVDGVVRHSSTSAARPANYTSIFTIGGYYSGSAWGQFANGTIDEFRVSKGVARWTSGFTPPTKAYNSTATIEVTPSLSAADTFETKTWDISATANADKNNIDGIVLTVVNADAANTFYVDNLYAGTVKTLQSYSESTIKTQGSYALKGIALVTDSLNKTLTRTIASPVNLSGVETLHFDIRASRPGINLSLAIRDSGGTWTSVSPNIINADQFQTVNWDISGVANADKDAIDRIRVTVDNATAENTFYIDNFYASAPPVAFQAYSESTIKTQGSYALKCVAAQTTSLNKTLTRTITSPIDLTGVNTIGFDIRASRTGSNITLGLHDSGGAWTSLTPNITAADTFQNVVWDISGVSDANKNAIDQVRITVANADVANTVYIDNFGPAGGALFDGTATVGGTKSLGQTGIISFGNTVSTAKPRMFNGLVGYVYRFTFTGIDPTTTVSHATVKAPIQPIVDLWDGVDRECMAFYVYKNNTYNDYTLNVYANEYDSTDAATYVSLNALAAGTNKLYFASYERLMGINFGLAGGHVNTTANTAMTVRYSSDGQNFVSAGTIDDGTSGGAISFSKSGTVTWNPPPAYMEFMSKVSKVTPRYHYEITFSQTLSNDVQLFYASGIPVQRQFGQYKFPLMAQDMLFLCCDMAGKKNAAIHSEYQTSQIFNGANSTEIEFGETGELTCGASLYNLYGYNLYNLIIFFKDSEMWKLSGDFPDWKRHQVSDKVGCPAPMTLKTVSLPGDIPQGLSRNVIIWKGSDGVYVSDGRAPLPIHGDIENYFDPKRAECIKPELLGESWADLDQTKMEYHLHVASGAAATVPDTELVFDLKRWKWYLIDRGTGKRLVAGTEVRDVHGNKYNYGFIDSGYMLRLENGTDFDGNSIVHRLGIGDLVFAENDFTTETRVERLELVTVKKSVTSNNILYTHYVDTEPVGTSFTLVPAATNRRVATIVQPINSKVGVFHSGLFEMTTNNEVTGFEPLALAYVYSQQYEKLTT